MEWVPKYQQKQEIVRSIIHALDLCDNEVILPMQQDSQVPSSLQEDLRIFLFTNCSIAL